MKKPHTAIKLKNNTCLKNYPYILSDSENDNDSHLDLQVFFTFLVIPSNREI